MSLVQPITHSQLEILTLFHRVLLATIRDKGLCPCPRCLVHHSRLDRMGLRRDMANRVKQVRVYLAEQVESARNYIYNLGRPITGTNVQNLLKETSGVPTVVCHNTIRYLLIHECADVHHIECFCRPHWRQVQAITNASCRPAA